MSGDQKIKDSAIPYLSAIYSTEEKYIPDCEKNVKNYCFRTFFTFRKQVCNILKTYIIINEFSKQNNLIIPYDSNS
jgi:hypothetical protein